MCNLYNLLIGLCDERGITGYRMCRDTGISPGAMTDFAADNCGADWYEQALAKAKSYLDIMPFSLDGLIEQLEYEGFTSDQAKFGAETAYNE